MEILTNTELKMNQAIGKLNDNFAKVSAGRANPVMLNKVLVEAYGAKTPISQVATISVPEARQLLVKPFDPNMLKDVEKAIMEADLGFNPTNDGEMLRIMIPQLTEEKRKLYVKDVKKYGEDAKITIRNIRKDSNNSVKKDDNLSTDEVKNGENQIQKMTEKFNKEIDDLVSKKEKELMTV